MHNILLYNKLIKCLYMFRALCAHHHEVKIALHSLWYHHTYRCDFMPLHFRAHVLNIRRSKLHYTASGIITPIGVMIPDAV